MVRVLGELPVGHGQAGSLELDALEADTVLTEAMGPELVRVFRVIKGAELARARQTVTDWEFAEYTHHL